MWAMIPAIGMGRRREGLLTFNGTVVNNDQGIPEVYSEVTCERLVSLCNEKGLTP